MKKYGSPESTERHLRRSPNAQRAVEMYNRLRTEAGWTKSNAWHGIARLLLACEVWEGGSWRPFQDVVVYRERNDFKSGSRGPNAVLERAEHLTTYLAAGLNVSRAKLCSVIGQYWRDPDIAKFQPHNLVGHAFRSLIVTILETWGDSGITYEEEVGPHDEFPGYQFGTRSKRAKIDVIARRGDLTVALISARWRFRHDRVDVVEEALAYAPAAQRVNRNCKFYAVLGEFAPNRLEKVLTHCPPQPNPAISAAVHFAPQLITDGLGENGRLAALKSLEWLIDQTFNWR
ncbi:MAG: hypothetical protein WCE23_00330 [Candidatus Binatus sp.]|uniref:hypothetical protein n=1 Tax=Candidatus Binatus sp. TaxID=2811406 RepID=UPI003C70F6DB